jgi:3-oxoacyl-[acyl-carrier protein] reductase
MITPIMLMRAVVDGMRSRRFGRIVNITSTSVKAPIPTLGLSNGARAGLTGFVAGIARQVVRDNVTINNLLPGPFDTDRLRSTLVSASKTTGRSVDALREERQQENPAKRFGTAEEFGQFCAFMCSAQAGYFTGQNVVLDGGAYPGTL